MTLMIIEYLAQVTKSETALPSLPNGLPDVTIGENALMQHATFTYDLYPLDHSLILGRYSHPNR